MTSSARLGSGSRSSERILVTTLTKRMAEDLSEYLMELGIKVHYLHSEVDLPQRVGILRDLRLGVFDVVVGINLLREGLDLPEVSLVAILDADKEGFLRSETALIPDDRPRGAPHQRAGDHVCRPHDQLDARRPSRRRSGGVRSRWRTTREHGIDPQTIRKNASRTSCCRSAARTRRRPRRGSERRRKPSHPEMPTEELERLIQGLEEEMHQAAKDLRFEYAARLRDEVQRSPEGADGSSARPASA